MHEAFNLASHFCVCTHEQDVWPEVLRCISRFELLSQMATGGITDMALFAPPTPEPASPSGFTKFRLGLFATTAKQPKPEGMTQSVG